ncbi:hypothetical protein BGZ63DRAFT_184490 [Mariannaea sp. PMI_226]|nr:hypothetical protein BGZ63DRAFT_184490 [Mariannaea sp. PMI_226]
MYVGLSLYLSTVLWCHWRGGGLSSHPCMRTLLCAHKTQRDGRCKLRGDIIVRSGHVTSQYRLDPLFLFFSKLNCLHIVYVTLLTHTYTWRLLLLSKLGHAHASTIISADKEGPPCFKKWFAEKRTMQHFLSLTTEANCFDVGHLIEWRLNFLIFFSVFHLLLIPFPFYRVGRGERRGGAANSSYCIL